MKTEAFVMKSTCVTNVNGRQLKCIMSLQKFEHFSDTIKVKYNPRIMCLHVYYEVYHKIHDKHLSQ